MTRSAREDVISTGRSRPFTVCSCHRGAHRLSRAVCPSDRTAKKLAIVGFRIVGGLVYLAMHGWIYISVPLMLAIVGSIGHAAHKISVLRDHLRSLDRRHVSLPKATAHRVPGSDLPSPEHEAS